MRSPVRVLAESVARKIAAGEVIDRPNAVVRELLDNSLDADAGQIDVHLESGGNDVIRVVDNGHGMARDDLERCILPHATSKIVTENDLQTTRTLGFRGEALSSIASVSRLQIVSAVDSEPAHRIQIHAGKLLATEKSPGQRGTSVDVESLFYNLPARKQFLKRAQTEGALCKSAFIDKALAFPDVQMRLFAGRELKLFLPSSTLEDRIVAAYPERTEPSVIHRLEGSGDGFSLTIIAGEPAAPRRDRRQLQIFVNQRRVWEYALVQAVEYAYRDYLHGGLYPVAYVLAEVDPELVDFNVHPAKREVRFRNLSEIHRHIVSMLGGFLRSFDRRASWSHAESATPELPTYEKSGVGPWHKPTGIGRQSESFDLSRALQVADMPIEGAVLTGMPQRGPGFRYLGQIMNLFLVVERETSLYLVDQHAAHERVIYDRLRAGGEGQELLFPVPFDLDEPEDSVLLENIPFMQPLGIGVEKDDAGRWALTRVPSSVHIDAEALIELIQELLDRPKNFERELYASLSCRAAVMDGDTISDAAAIEIIAAVLDLENARCPHGRPIWAEFSRDALFELVGRT